MSTQRGNKNSDAIRILQRDRDASARATHLKAEIGMVPNSTIERKIMSTKTSIKRIALVAAAALTLGGFSAVSASAADNTYMFAYTADGLATGTVANTTANGVAGPANYVTLAFTANAVGIATISGGTFGTGSGNVTVNTGSTSAVIATALTGRLTVLTPTVGTITVNYYNNVSAGVYSSTVTETVVITVNAAQASGVYSSGNTTSYIGAGETFTALTADAAVSAINTYAANESATATLLVNYKDGVSTGSAITYTSKDTLTATITSGPGTIYVPTITSAGYGLQFDSTSPAWPNVANTGGSTVGSAAVGKYTASALTDINGRVAFMIFANGQSGVSTIVVKNSAGTVIATKTVTFTGTTAASISAKLLKTYVGADTALATKGVIAVTIKDASGNPIVGVNYAPTPTYSSSAYGTVIQYGAGGDGADTGTTDATGTVTLGWTAAALKYGPVTVTLTDPTTATLVASVVVTNSSAIAKTVAITAPASVDLGQPFAFTVTAKDANGYGIPDGAASVVTSAVHYAGITTADLTPTFAAGVATIKAVGPTVSSTVGKSTFTLKGTAGVADTNLDKTLSATDVVVTYSVNGTDSSSLAYDAASAATDAANNAYEEAQNATQAASDALAAVKALAVQVKALIALVNKIKAKLKA